jgi:hypothetical protein
MKTRLPILFAGLLLGSVAAQADIIAYDASLNTLPSAQGWAYSADGGWLESSVYSVAGGTLHQTTMGRGFWEGTGSWYAPAPGLVWGDSFSAAFRARVTLSEQTGGLPDENSATALSPYGFGLGLANGSRAVVFGVTPSYVAISPSDGSYPNAPLFQSDNTDYHDYLITGNFVAGTWSCYRDGTFLGSGAMEPTSSSFAVFGDISGGGNADGNWLSVQVNSVPEPSTVVLLAGGAAACLLFRRRQ